MGPDNLNEVLAALAPEDRAAARACLHAIHGLTGDALAGPLADALAECPDPLKALVGLNRFLEHSDHPDDETRRAVSSPRYVRMLTALFAQGRLLTDTLCRNPGYAAWLWEQASLDAARDRHAVLEEVTQAFKEHASFDARCAWMRRYTRRELLRIAAREVFMYASFESVVADISTLADAMIEAACMAARDELLPRMGTPTTDDASRTPITFCVLAMGKLGGAELNFSSDIDLLFLYSADGCARGERTQPVATEGYYGKLGELIIKALSEQTADGRVFRVDMRLRPFGRSGPIASSLETALEYYAGYGRAWERQAMIKARPCAGDLALGDVFLEQLRPFVYPRYFDDATLEDIRGVKQQTEAIIAEKGRTEREVKLGRGGIRDIEFTVQMLQLLNGGRWPELRVANTLQAMRALGARHCLRPLEAETLESTYVFLRRIEHRLQIEGGLQTHVLPENEQERLLLARRLGYETAEAFMNVYRERTDTTRSILERFLAVKGDGTLWVTALLDPESAGEDGLKRLQAMGFHDPAHARDELLLLANGPEHAPYTRDTAQQFAAVTPFLLDALQHTPDPDAVLARLGRILAQLHAPTTLYNLLQHNPNLTRYVIAVIANSDYLADMLVRDIGLLDVMGTPGHLDDATSEAALEETFAMLEQAADPAVALYRLRDGETLKIACRELVQGVSVAAVGDELTRLAAFIVKKVVQRALESVAARYGAATMPFAVLALGKFGGREMGYGSDLDLVFVYQDNEAEEAAMSLSPAEYFAAAASQVLRTLKEPTRHGILYDVDVRLRPDGSKGALAIPMQRLRHYYLEEAHFWERFALMKARAVAGDPAFCDRLNTFVRDIAFAHPPDAPALESVETLRTQLAQDTTPYDLKRRKGGLAEIEFATRLLQLQHAHAFPELRGSGVFAALHALRGHGCVAEDEHAALCDGYRFFRQVLNRARMMRGSTSAKLPEAPETLHRLAVCLEVAGGDMMAAVEEQAQQVHAAYKHIYKQVYAAVTDGSPDTGTR